MYQYPIDYNEYSSDEIIIIINFFSMIEDINENIKIDSSTLLNQYHKYQSIINSQLIEKQIDREFEKASGYSIYRTMNKYK